MASVWRDAKLLNRHIRRQAFFSLPFCLSVTSGGFDPLHIGHLRCIRAASRLGDKLAVIVNGDGFLSRKKGHVFMGEEDRAEIIAGLDGVDYVLIWDDGTQFVDGAIRQLCQYGDVFAKGGDRSKIEDIAECERLVCDELGVRLELGVGGSDKVRSSSHLLSKSALGLPIEQLKTT